MALPIGFKHTDASRRKMGDTRRGRKHSASHKAKISAAHLGKKKPKRYERQCVCGTTFISGANNAIFCSIQCKRAARGHGLRHAPQFAHFDKLCAICGAIEQLVGDHDHKTGTPRGILCRNCNLAIGNMSDNPERLRRAADYLTTGIN